MKTTVTMTRKVKIELTEDQVRDAVMAYVLEHGSEPLTNRDVDVLELKDITFFWDTGREGPRAQVERSTEQ